MSNEIDQTVRRPRSICRTAASAIDILPDAPADASRRWAARTSGPLRQGPKLGAPPVRYILRGRSARPAQYFSHQTAQDVVFTRAANGPSHAYHQDPPTQ